MHTTSRRIVAVTMALLPMLLLGACGDDKSTTSAATTTTEPAAAGKVEVTGVWARTSPAVASAGAAYMQIVNGSKGDDALVAVSVAPTVAAKVELHETIAAGPGSGSMSSTTMGTATSMPTTSSGAPMMKMVPVDRIAVPAGKTVALAPGGYHVMLLDLAKPLVVGTTIELTLSFEQAGDIKVTAEVRDTAP